MTRDDIIRMAMEVGLYSGNPRTPGTGNMIVRKLERFAALVAEHEREACAKVCDDIHTEYGGEDVLATWCAQLIRQRGKE